MSLKDPITAHELHAALSALSIPTATALRDPVRAMRITSTCSEEAIRAALRAVLVEGYDLDGMEGDELRLFACGVLARVLVRARRKRAVERAASVPDVKIAA